MAALGAVVVLVSLGVGMPSWVGVGVAYLLTAGVVRRLRVAGRTANARHGAGIAVGTVAIAAAVVGIELPSDRSVLSTGFWDIVLNDLVLAVTVAAVVAASLTDDRRRRLLAGLVVVALLAVVIGETILTSMPYDGELTLLDHLLAQVAYRVQGLLGGLLLGLPPALLLRGVPARIDRLFAAEPGG